MDIHDDMIRRTMRHVQVMAQPEGARPNPARPDSARLDSARPDSARLDSARLDSARPGAAPPFPDDWFDLSPALWADLGSMTYLLSLTGWHRRLPLADIAAMLEPPLRLGQYRIFRSVGGHPRAFLTWAGLTAEAEYDFAIRHHALRPTDWNAGASKWMVTLAAPFGHVEQIVPMLTANPRETRVRTLWHNRTGERYRILEWSRPPGATRVDVRSYGVAQFARLLTER